MNDGPYDRQINDGRILRSLGLMLRRDEHGVATVASPLPGEDARRISRRSSARVAYEEQVKKLDELTTATP